MSNEIAVSGNVAVENNISLEIMEKLVEETVERRLNERRKQYRGKRIGIYIIAAIALLGTGAAIAGFIANDGTNVPMQIPYRGVLELNGEPVKSGTVPMTFDLYDSEIAASSFWSETQASVPVQDGQFSVVLGANTNNPILASKFQSPNMYLQVTVNGQTLAGRQRLLSVPYALGALNAVRASGADLADNATNAGYATNANYASSAGSANNSANAVHATHADDAYNATNVNGGSATINTLNVSSKARFNGGVYFGVAACIIGNGLCPPGSVRASSGYDYHGLPMCCYNDP